MKLDMLPTTYYKMVDERANKKINEVWYDCNSTINSINSARTTKSDLGECIQGGGIYGVGVGNFAGLSVCSCQYISGRFGISEAVNVYCEALVIFGIIGLIIGFIVYIFDNSSYNETNENADYRISCEKRYRDEKIQEIKSEAQKEKQQYYTEFNNNVQNLSVQFAESELAKEVIEWMTNGFCKTIDAADRKGHIEKITVPFVFNVFNNKISCNLGTFDFELKRCKNLNGPLEQMALAKAVASAIQLEIKMRYPKDLSGTDVSIDISYSYKESYPATTISYVAPNGNYEAVRSW